MDQKGTIVVWLEKLFGRNWKTSLCAVLIFLPQIFSVLQEWIVDLGVSTAKLNNVSLLFAALAALAAKSQGVTGLNRIATTGLPGPTEDILIAESAAATPGDPKKQIKEVKQDASI